MKKIFWLIMLGIVIQTVPVWAASTDGGTPGTLLYWGVGARAIGMGRMHLSVADDGTTPYWNPAAMSQVDRKTFATMYASLLGLDAQYNSQYAYLGLVWPTIGTETWGVSLTQLSSGQFEKTDNTAKVLGSFDVGTRVLTLAYSRQLNEGFSLGLSGVMLSNSVDTQSDSLLSGDLSAFYKLDKLRMAGVIKNALTYSLGKSKDIYPLTLKFGVSTMMLDDTLLLGVDMVRTEGAEVDWALGGEYKLWQNYFLRGGYNSGDMYGGLGLKLFGMNCDFAVHMAEVDLSYFFTVNYEFGHSRWEERESIITKNTAEMNAAIEKGDFVKAFNKGNYILSLDATDLKVKKIVSMLNTLNTIMATNVKKQKYSSPKIQDFIRLAAQDFIREDKVKAINKLKYVLFLQPQDNPLATDLLTKLVQDPAEVKGQDIVGEKLRESLVNFYGAKYRQVIDNCEEIIQLEPDNVDAYLRQGSAYFMLMQEDDAIQAWQKVLEIDPGKREMIEQVIQKLKDTREQQPDENDGAVQQNPEQQPTVPALSLGNYNGDKKAQKILSKLRDQGIPAAIEDQGNNLFRIVVRDPAKTALEIKAVADKLKSLGYKTFWIK